MSYTATGEKLKSYLMNIGEGNIYLDYPIALTLESFRNLLGANSLVWLIYRDVIEEQFLAHQKNRLVEHWTIRAIAPYRANIYSALQNKVDSLFGELRREPYWEGCRVQEGWNCAFRSEDINEVLCIIAEISIKVEVFV